MHPFLTRPDALSVALLAVALALPAQEVAALPDNPPVPLAPVAASSPTPPSAASLLEKTLRDRDARFDPAAGLISGRAGGPGYHTRLTKDQVVHGTKDNADYVLLLLTRGQPEDLERARSVLDRLLALQVTDPAATHYGLWGWFAEEPPAAMAPADWNWADFIGVRLIDILALHEARLAPGQPERVRAALRHATASIVKRNIGPDYTNICTMGAAVCLGAGRLLLDADLVAYGRRRIAAQRAACEANGGVPEYNSPGYTTILLQELERILRHSDDPEARQHAEWLRQRMWHLIADQFHPGTGQWAGAQGRVYHDVLRPAQALFLWQRTGIPPRGATRMVFMASLDDLVDPAPFRCPPDLAARFAALPNDPHEVQQTWMTATATEPAVILTSWFSAGATLGSVNWSTTWAQHRPITGYWRAAEGVASVRMHLLKDGKDFASGALRTVQQGPRLLTVFGLAADQGDWHCHLDRPADGTFTIKDLRLRLDLDAKDARIAAIATSGWVLAAGDHRLVAHLGEARFDGQPVAWEAGEHEGGVHLEAVLYQGAPRRLAPRAVAETTAALGLELVPVGQQPVGGTVTGQQEGDQRRWRWDGLPLELTAPRLVAP